MKLLLVETFVVVVINSPHVKHVLGFPVSAACVHSAGEFPKGVLISPTGCLTEIEGIFLKLWGFASDSNATYTPSLKG